MSLDRPSGRSPPHPAPLCSSMGANGRSQVPSAAPWGLPQPSCSLPSARSGVVAARLKLQNKGLRRWDAWRQRQGAAHVARLGLVLQRRRRRLQAAALWQRGAGQPLTPRAPSQKRCCGGAGRPALRTAAKRATVMKPPTSSRHAAPAGCAQGAGASFLPGALPSPDALQPNSLLAGAVRLRQHSGRVQAAAPWAWILH